MFQPANVMEIIFLVGLSLIHGYVLATELGDVTYLHLC